MEEWYEYEGTIGTDERIRIALTLTPEEPTPHAVQGVFFRAEDLRDVQLQGTLHENGRLSLQTIVENPETPSDQFEGHFRNDLHSTQDSKPAPDFLALEGTWSAQPGTLKRPFTVSLIYIMHVEPGKSRYHVAGIDDDASLEEFASQVRTAIADGRCDALKAMISFPIAAGLGDRWSNGLDADTLIEHCDLVLDREFRDSVRRALPHRLFASWQGVMLGGKGEVWISRIPERGDLKIVAINN